MPEKSPVSCHTSLICHFKFDLLACSLTFPPSNPLGLGPPPHRHSSRGLSFWVGGGGFGVTGGPVSQTLHTHTPSEAPGGEGGGAGMGGSWCGLSAALLGDRVAGARWAMPHLL